MRGGLRGLAFALIQGADVVAQQFGWPEGVRRGLTLALVLGFFVMLVLAWYHGERSVQRVNGTEILVIALLLLWVVACFGDMRARPLSPKEETVRVLPRRVRHVASISRRHSPARCTAVWSQALSRPSFISNCADAA